MPRETWDLTDHACAACFGRVLSRPDGEGARVYRCSNCAAEGTGQKASVICACGARMKTGRNFGLRCLVNPAPTPEVPSQVIVEAVGASISIEPSHATDL